MPNLHRASWGFMQSSDFPIPVGHWKFGEGRGNALADSSPEGNDGVNHGATWTKGYLGPGLRFDNLDDYALISDDVSLQITGKITAIATIYPQGYGLNDYARIFQKGNGADSYFLNMLNPGTEESFGFYAGRTIHAAPDRSITLNTWQRIGGTFDLEHVRLYKEGVLLRTRVETDVIASTVGEELYIGNRDDFDRSFYGIIDELLIFDKVLTDAQMRQDGLGYR